MSPLSARWRSHPKVLLMNWFERVALTALANAFAVSVLSAAAMADRAPVATGAPNMNFVGSFAASADDAKRPNSSLLARIRHAIATDTIIEPAAATSTTTALSPAPEEGEEAGVPDSLVTDVRDPLEPVNRAIFGFNEIVDLLIMRPISHAYRIVVPQPLRTGVSNALHNFATPVIFANDILQGKPRRAKTTFIRFLVNSTAGFGGLVDAAAAAGLESHSEDFGQTLAVWGVGPGVYLVLPVLGPSTSRDAVGLVGDAALHPATWLMWNLEFFERSSPVIAYTVSAHEYYLDEAQALRRTSPDFYATVRDIYAQRRAADIADGGFAGADQGDDDLAGADFDTLPPIPTE